MRTWKVTYTARIREVVYKRQTVEVEVTEQQFIDFFGEEPKDEDNPCDIEQLAVEHGETDDAAWEIYRENDESLDEIDFEVSELEEAKLCLTPSGDH